MKNTKLPASAPAARTPDQRISDLRNHVAQLPVDETYRAELMASIERYRDQIIARPEHGPGWDDLEAIQQVTLGDRMERYLRALSESDHDLQ